MNPQYLNIDYQHFFEENVNLLCVASLDAYFIKINKAFEQQLGYTKAELLSRSFLDFVHINDVDKTISELANLALGKTTLSFQNRYRTSQNKYINLLWNAKVDEKSGLIYASATNVTEMQMMQTVLHDAQRIAKVGGWEVNFNDNNIYWSEGVYLIHELPLNYEITLEKAINFYHPSFVDAITNAVNNAIENGVAYDLELQIITAKGRTIWVRAKGEAVKENGKVMKIKGTFQDIDEIKNTRNKLHETIKALETSNRDLEQFAYVASHDLIEPLRMVSSFVQLLRRRYINQLDEEAQEYINFATDGTNRMKLLIEQLLEYSKIEYKQAKCIPTNFNQLFETVLLEFKPIIEKRQINIQIAEFPTICCYPKSMKILINNLIDNAIKFNKSALPTIKVDIKELDNEWQFQITDNGIGIDIAYHDKVFIIFQRLNKRYEFNGTGMGLALCKKVMDIHHGHIWFESELGEGTTFFFKFPKPHY
ncbi:MAG: ATP-binding protein [Chitinophagales bacterium]